jgi:hypothetical protein
MMRKPLLALCGAIGVAALGLALTGRPASAHEFPCDFLTGGGYIFTTASETHPDVKGTFAIGGGCKHGSPTWGHLEYHDHYTGLNAHWNTITAYLLEGDLGDTSTSPKNGQPTGTRLVCGTARTNVFGDVDFMVRARDLGEPGVNDEFDIRLAQGGTIVYTTENEPGAPNKLGAGDGGGGNIQLHNPNPSTTGNFGGDCPARAAGPGQ